MDGYTRFVMVHLLTSKSSDVINKHLKEYVLWAERQAGRNKSGAPYTAKRVWTDKGGEFVNTEMADWYVAQGIEHVRVGPKSSQLNLCERTHQSLIAMVKATMEHAGFPRSFWPEALRNAVYVKNRIYNKGTQGVPYEMMFGSKPDLHHIRKFGSLAYAHIPVTPGRRKHHPNAKIGFVLGYTEDVVGCKLYFPAEHTAKYVPDLRVAENVVYKDRHAVDEDELDLSSLHFTRNAEYTDTDATSPNVETNEALTEEELDETNDILSAEVNERDSNVEMDTDCSVRCPEAMRPSDSEWDIVPESDVSDEQLAGCDQEQYEPLAGGDQHVDEEVMQSRSIDEAETDDYDLEPHDDEHEEGESSGRASLSEPHVEENMSVAGTCGSSDPASEEVLFDEDEDVTVASVFSPEGDERFDEDTSLSSGFADGEKNGHDNGVILNGDDDTGAVETLDARAMMPTQQTGKRTHRDETRSEEERMEKEAAKQEPKRTRTGLREYHERRLPRFLKDYVTNVTLSNSRILDKNGRPIRASEVKLPRNPREMMRSKWREFFLTAELEEMAALKAKGVIEEIPADEMPADAKAVNTMPA
ncbi:hypothetical protein PF005_g30335 [Phytophthora fragariae]|uniref:Integrase catalytic domain-containing protein n=2 Tax=Phytophthora fragariae TaxID=53985 RepID=A0A6A3VAC9_9STRA|nr:hypothetical protein PF005_g30335 [Phytophthora fragariae]KAE9165441.1 hypothetical protein PF004_g29499 [Phytophthora fragariae]